MCAVEYVRVCEHVCVCVCVCVYLTLLCDPLDLPNCFISMTNDT